MNVSKESRDFLDRLSIYLITSGKNEKEIREITGELEDHLHEAEQNGKSVEDITGLTPKAYMDQIAKEMPFDKMGVFKYALVLIFGSIAFYVMGDAINGTMDYSWIILIGLPVMILFYGVMVARLFKYTAGKVLSKKKEFTLLLVMSGVPLAGMGGVVFLEKFIGDTAVSLGTTGRMVGFVLCALILIGISIWSKTPIMIILPIVVFVPQYFIERSSWSEETQLMMIGMIFPIGFMISLGISFLQIWRKERKQIA
ncbi:HAAS domain-containing protein [Rossellomorea marisflavi]|uniref:HAAS transmembrane region domain-containing protein n=1 Tax=Rossellomorea marisflavi TaxID=189381 RepID=A0A161RQI1_9BACI|nr:hypothetical protein [Rossellomorea marisflavi]KZE48738.1 hypothetical protein AV649_19390 [Rossellomorea marisflavi]QHA35574.1 hypothetical protein D5E69_06860 [Rossellomorea marisflavi]